MKLQRIKYKWGSALYRISVFRSSKHIYAQVSEIQSGKTLFSSSDLSLKVKTKNDIEKAQLVGKELAKKIKAKKLGKLVFDRSAYKYHGRVRALAEGIREEGVKI